MFKAIKTFTPSKVELYIMLFGNEPYYLGNKMLEIVYKMRIEL
jgi:hypothetical protein